MLLALLLLVPPAMSGPCDALDARIGAALSSPRCGTMALAAEVRAARGDACLPSVLDARGLGPHTQLPPPPPPGGVKQVRNAYAPTQFVIETDNFAIWYGSLRTFSHEGVQLMADNLEVAWDHQIGVLGYPVPVSSDTYKFNVYIDGTNAGPADTGAFVGGYYTRDPQGFPMIVLGYNVVSTEFGTLAASHELFHANQDAFDPDEPIGRDWYAEATAVWVENEVFPDMEGYADSLPGYALIPDAPLHLWEGTGDDTLESLHPYGAFIFPRYVSELAADTDLIYRSWAESEADDNVLTVLDELLAEQGSSVEQAFFDFATRNATWDYAHEDWYQDAIVGYGGYATATATRPSGAVVPPTTWNRPVQDLPHSYGANYWELRNIEGPLRVSFEGYADPDQWHAAVVGQRDGEHISVPIPLGSDHTGEVVVEGFESLSEAHVVVAVAAGRNQLQTEFSYGFRVEEVDPADLLEAEEPGGCSCAVPSPAPLSVLPLVALLGLRRRTQLD